MTRSTPDPVFTEAGRAALLAEVRAEQQTSTRSRARRRRLGVRELLIGTAVVAAAATILVVVHTAPRPSADPAERPTASAPAPVTTAPTPDPTSTASAAALVGPTGSRLRTEAEIRSWAATLHISAVSTEQDVILVRCMAAKGFLYDPIRQRTGDLRAGHSGMSPSDEARWDLAYGGTAAPGDYTWQTAGCDGLAVHETGQDGQD